MIWLTINWGSNISLIKHAVCNNSVISVKIWKSVCHNEVNYIKCTKMKRYIRIHHVSTNKIISKKLACPSFWNDDEYLGTTVQSGCNNHTWINVIYHRHRYHSYWMSWTAMRYGKACWLYIVCFIKVDNITFEWCWIADLYCVTSIAKKIARNCKNSFVHVLSSIS